MATRTTSLLALALACGACAAAPARPARTDAPAPPAPLSSRALLTLETTEGMVHCALDGARAPRATSMVIGLASGNAPWREPDGAIVRRPYYDGLAFFRTIPGVYAQTGCAVGDGSGGPGYRLPVESDASDRVRLARPGALLLARYTAPTDRADPSPPPPGMVIGAQLVIALADMSHLAGSVTVLGVCSDLDVVAHLTVATHTPRILRADVRIE